MKFKLSIIAVFVSILCYSQSNENNFKTKDNIVLINISAGPSFRLGKMPPNVSPVFKNYVKDLKSGFSYDAHFNFMFDENRGLGLRYNSFNSKGSLNNVYVTAPNGQTGYGFTSDNITISYIGADYLYIDKSPNKKVEYKLNLSMGYMGYQDKTNVLGEYKITGSTFGMVTDFGVNFFITDYFSVGPQLGIVGGAIRRFDITGANGFKGTLKLDSKSVESLWRIDLGINAIVHL